MPCNEDLSVDQTWCIQTQQMGAALVGAEASAIHWPAEVGS